MVTGTISTFDGKKDGPKLYPAKWFFHKHEQEPPTTEVAMWRRPARTCTSCWRRSKPDRKRQPADHDQSARELGVFGFGVLAFGTIIALLPERAFSFAMAKMPEESGRAAATSAVLLLALAAVEHALSRAAHESSTSHRLPRNEIEKPWAASRVPVRWLWQGADWRLHVRLRQRHPPADCDARRSGKSEDEILQHFIAQYGSEELLGAPIDEGFNRVAWLFPYAPARPALLRLASSREMEPRHVAPAPERPRRPTRK
jgi:hypothetical protein